MLATIRSTCALILVLTAAVAASPPGTVLPSPPSGQKWEPIPSLSDEFDGTTLDPHKWLNKHPRWPGRDPSRFDPSNVSVVNGELLLRSTAPATQPTAIHAACVASTQPSASYGYYEARMQASKLSMTSSFWFQGKGIEIDVVEQFGDSLLHPEKSRQMLMNTHYFIPNWKADKSTPRHAAMSAGSADGFHVYGVWWKDSKSATFYLDGAPVADVEFGGDFNMPMAMFFDTETFPKDGLPDARSLADPTRNAMHVDWVRAWRLATAN